MRQSDSAARSAAGRTLKVSLVTPSFEQASFVEETLRSVLEQSYPAIEYIVMDGGSRDGTTEILERYRQRIDQLIIEPDEGQADALSKGFARAGGEIFGWLNSDDFLLPGAIEAVVEAFERAPDVDVVYGHYYLCDRSSRLLRRVYVPDFHWPTMLHENAILGQPAAFFRRSAYERVGGIDPSFHFCMDFDLWTRLHLCGARYARLDRTLAAFRLHEAGKTTRLSEVQVREHAGIAEKILGRPRSTVERALLPRWLRLRRLALRYFEYPQAVVEDVRWLLR